MPQSDYRPHLFQSTHCLETITLQSSNPGTGCKYLAHFFHLPLLYLPLQDLWSCTCISFYSLTIFLVKSQIRRFHALVYRRRKNRRRRKRIEKQEWRKKERERIKDKGRRWRRRSKRKQEEKRRGKKGSRRGKRWRGKKRRRKPRMKRKGRRREKRNLNFLINAMHQMLYFLSMFIQQYSYSK